MKVNTFELLVFWPRGMKVFIPYLEKVKITFKQIFIPNNQIIMNEIFKNYHISPKSKSVFGIAVAVVVVI
jgi:alkylhydroperoxidase/carboxymuconolactone decarboxylase family protein YurZ